MSHAAAAVDSRSRAGIQLPASSLVPRPHGAWHMAHFTVHITVYRSFHDHS